MKPQFIDQNGKHAFVVLPYEDYEDLIDSLALLQAREENTEFSLPHDIVKRIILDEDNPLKVIREWRDMTQDALADKAGLTKTFISMLENDKRPITKKTAVKLAKVLRVDWDIFTE